MDYKTLTEEQLQTERQNIMDEITRRNDLADIPKQAEEMALRFEALGGNKSDLAQIVNNAKAEEPVVEEHNALQEALRAVAGDKSEDYVEETESVQ